MPNTPFAGYVRVSSVGGRAGPSFISPDVQRDTIRRLAAFHKVELGEVVEELDVSAKKPIDERELGRLVRAIEAGEYGGLLVWKLSRFSRSLLDGVTVADRITRAGGRLVGEDFDSKAPMGKAILGFLLGWAEEEWEARRAGWRAAQERAVARGVQPARSPIGYLRVAEGDDRGRLVPDPATADLVRKVFQARARRASLQECADIIGGSRSGVRQLLSSPTYLGHIRMGDMLNENAHVPLIDRRTWELAQWGEAATPRDGSLAGIGVLAGMLRCAGCGFVCSVSGGGDKYHIASYSCRGRRASGACPARASAAVHTVDAYVLPLLRERAGTIDLEAALGELFDAQTAWAAADQELRAFLEGASIVALGPGLYAAEVTRRREALRNTTDAYSDALDAQDRLAASGELGGRRELARRLIASVTLTKADSRGRWQPIEERLEITWKAT
jgi:DNA invertase Pin-like site-specific DNA recombinase